MSSTVTNYSQNINTTYPVPGVDNDTQGFRDNFSNIKNALTIAAAELSSLQSNTAKLNTGTNDFNYNKIYRTSLQGSGQYSPNISSISTNTTVNFLQGSYQKFTVDGTITMNVGNWPQNTIHGEVRLELYNASSSTNAVVTFNGNGGTLKKEASLSNPYTITTASWSSPVIFDLWTSDGGTTVFLKSVGGPFV